MGFPYLHKVSLPPLRDHLWTRAVLLIAPTCISALYVYHVSLPDSVTDSNVGLRFYSPIVSFPYHCAFLLFSVDTYDDDTTLL